VKLATNRCSKQGNVRWEKDTGLAYKVSESVRLPQAENFSGKSFPVDICRQRLYVIAKNNPANGVSTRSHEIFALRNETGVPTPGAPGCFYLD
jgi:hypothetical protein